MREVAPSPRGCPARTKILPRCANMAVNFQLLMNEYDCIFVQSYSFGQVISKSSIDLAPIPRSDSSDRSDHQIVCGGPHLPFRSMNRKPLANGLLAKNSRDVAVVSTKLSNRYPTTAPVTIMSQRKANA
jgi:hypothetical protein